MEMLLVVLTSDAQLAEAGTLTPPFVAASVGGGTSLLMIPFAIGGAELGCCGFGCGETLRARVVVWTWVACAACRSRRRGTAAEGEDQPSSAVVVAVVGGRVAEGAAMACGGGVPDMVWLSSEERALFVPSSACSEQGLNTRKGKPGIGQVSSCYYKIMSYPFKLGETGFWGLIYCRLHCTVSSRRPRDRRCFSAICPLSLASKVPEKT